MPIVTEAFWELVHNWDTEEYEEWTEDMMLDELRELDKARVTLMPKVTLLKFIENIEENGAIRTKTKLVRFGNMKSVLKSWKHVTTTCENFGREWLAQDESRLVCFEGKKCNHYDESCKKYKPMLKARSIKKLIKKEKVVFT